MPTRIRTAGVLLGEKPKFFRRYRLCRAIVLNRSSSNDLQMLGAMVLDRVEWSLVE